jgi:hypothetical protein
MNRRPILCLTLTILLAATPAAAATAQVSTQAANSQLKPDDAFVDVHDFVFGDGEILASLKLHYLTLGKPRRDASGAITNRFCYFTAPPDRLPTSCRLASSIRFTVRGSRWILVAIFLQSPTLSAPETQATIGRIARRFPSFWLQGSGSGGASTA